MWNVINKLQVPVLGHIDINEPRLDGCVNHLRQRDNNLMLDVTLMKKLPLFLVQVSMNVNKKMLWQLLLQFRNQSPLQILLIFS